MLIYLHPLLKFELFYFRSVGSKFAVTMEMALGRRSIRAYGRRNFVGFETGVPSACLQDGNNGGDVYTPGACCGCVVLLYMSGDG